MFPIILPYCKRNVLFAIISYSEYLSIYLLYLQSIQLQTYKFVNNDYCRRKT